MFALEVEYLTGRAVATARHAREEAEWPPHPGRLYSALVDAAFQTAPADADQEPPQPGAADCVTRSWELLGGDKGQVWQALEWLEKLPHPAIAATDARFRTGQRSFVPTNDDNKQEKVVKEKRTIYPVLGDGMGLRRLRAERRFPTALPESPFVYFIWDQTPDKEIREALESLAANVTYLGHSSSLVRVSRTDSPPPAAYEPDPSGRFTFRVPSAGRLKELIGSYCRCARPSPGLYAAYRRSAEVRSSPPAPSGTGVFGDIVGCELDPAGPFLPLSGAVKLLAAVRHTLIRETNTDAPPVKSLVSGHTPDGEPTRDHHVAYIPLANVGHLHADGRVMGFGIVLPRGLNRYSDERRAIMRVVAGMPPVHIDGGHEWAVALPTETVPRSLQASAYAGPSKTWATVTPVLCDYHPKDRDGERVEDVIADSVERVTGRRPVYVEAGPISRLRGVPPSHAFPNRRKDGDQPRHRTHAFVAFGQDVSGPIIAGAGRYLGLGLFRAWKPEGRG